MRYICEFSYSPVDYKNYAATEEELIEDQKRYGNHRMGIMIGEKIGWEQYSVDEFQRYKLEVQAFSEKDWREFKQDLKGYITSAAQHGLSTFHLVVVGKMIQKLEMIGSLQPQTAVNPTGTIDDNQKQDDKN